EIAHLPQHFAGADPHQRQVLGRHHRFELLAENDVKATLMQKDDEPLQRFHHTAAIASDHADIAKGFHADTRRASEGPYYGAAGQEARASCAARRSQAESPSLRKRSCWAMGSASTPWRS